MRISDWSSDVCSSDLPPALTDMLVWFRDTYGDIPVYITENGAAFYDPPKAGPDGIDDPLRCDYLRTHISAIGDAIRQGVDVRGYMAWSLLDNLEDRKSTRLNSSH